MGITIEINGQDLPIEVSIEVYEYLDIARKDENLADCLLKAHIKKKETFVATESGNYNGGILDFPSIVRHGTGKLLGLTGNCYYDFDLEGYSIYTWILVTKGDFHSP